MSFANLIRGIRESGVRQWWRDLNYIGTVKTGRIVGTDQFGNRYWENPEEIPGRHRWVEYVQHDVNGSQVPAEWHGWVNHIRALPPHEDPVMQASRRHWQQPHRENLTGSRGAYKPYSTTKAAFQPWEPTVAERG